MVPMATWQDWGYQSPSEVLPIILCLITANMSNLPTILVDTNIQYTLGLNPLAQIRDFGSSVTPV